MPSDLFLPEINLDLIYPPFLERLLAAKARARARGVSMLCTFGYRSFAESDLLHQKYLAGGARAAPAGYSSHNFGLASDEALIVTGSPRRVVRWGKHDFDVFAGEASRLGLHWGAFYGDKPHFSWPGFVSGADLAPLREIWMDNPSLLPLPRLRKCWDFVDAHSPPLPPLESP